MILLDTGMKKIPDKCCLCKFFRVHNQMYCTAVAGYTTVSKPRDRKPAWCPLHEVTDTDTISRQQAIDEVSNNSPELAKENGELISRKAAIDYCYQLINVEHQQGSDEMNFGQERVNQTETILHHLEFMPSAQPQRMRAKWIATTSLQEDQITWRDYKCSNCSHHRRKPMNFCEVCGAKMER